MRDDFLSVLTPAQKSAVTEKGNGATRAEIARQRGVSHQAIKKLWSRARKRLLASMPPELREEFQSVQTDSPRRVRAAQLSAIPAASI